MTMSSHIIRLRAPWKVDRVGRERLWRRRFGEPTGIGGDDRLALVVEGLTADAEVAINGRVLGNVGPAAGLGEFDVTGLLLMRNELTLRTSKIIEPCDESGPPCRVSLRIDSADPPA